MNTQIKIDPILSVAQVCEVLGVGQTTVYKLVKLGKLARPYILDGTSRVGWKQSDVAEYLDHLPQKNPLEISRGL